MTNIVLLICDLLVSCKIFDEYYKMFVYNIGDKILSLLIYHLIAYTTKVQIINDLQFTHNSIIINRRHKVRPSPLRRHRSLEHRVRLGSWQKSLAELPGNVPKWKLSCPDSLTKNNLADWIQVKKIKRVKQFGPGSFPAAPSGHSSLRVDSGLLCKVESKQTAKLQPGRVCSPLRHRVLVLPAGRARRNWLGGQASRLFMRTERFD